MMIRLGFAIMTMFVATRASAGVVNFPKRATFAKYAETKGVFEDEITRRYAATVVIRCNGHQATAQFTGSLEWLTTSDHLFFNRENCMPIAKAEDCVITVRTVSRQRRYKGFQMADHGYRKKLEAIERGEAVCPEGGLNWGDDWAVLRLTDKTAIREIAKEVRAYKIPMPADVHQENENVVAVAGAALDFFDFTSDGEKFYPRNLQDCSVKDVTPFSGEGSYVETDCDTAELTSGGSLLRSGPGSDTLIGIHMGSFESKQELTRALSENRLNIKPYKRGAWSAIYVSLDGEFLQSLRRLLHINHEI
jgi:hypothetical protein